MRSVVPRRQPRVPSVPSSSILRVSVAHLFRSHGHASSPAPLLLFFPGKPGHGRRPCGAPVPASHLRFLPHPSPSASSPAASFLHVCLPTHLRHGHARSKHVLQWSRIRRNTEDVPFDHVRLCGSSLSLPHPTPSGPLGGESRHPRRGKNTGKRGEISIRTGEAFETRRRGWGMGGKGSPTPPGGGMGSSQGMKRSEAVRVGSPPAAVRPSDQGEGQVRRSKARDANVHANWIGRCHASKRETRVATMGKMPVQDPPKQPMLLRADTCGGRSSQRTRH